MFVFVCSAGGTRQLLQEAPAWAASASSASLAAGMEMKRCCWLLFLQQLLGKCALWGTRAVLTRDAPLWVCLAQLLRNASMWEAQVESRVSRLFLQGAVCPVSPVAGRDGVIPALDRNLHLQIT